MAKANPKQVKKSRSSVNAANAARRAALNAAVADVMPPPRPVTSEATKAKIRASLRATLLSRRGSQRLPMLGERPVEERKTLFLEAYEADGSISGAAKKVHVSVASHYDWLRADDDYAKRFKAAHEAMVDVAEKELRRRGVAGYDKPIVYQGEITGTVKEHSDACLIFYLKGRRSDVFKEKTEVTGRDGAPLAIQIYVPGNDRLEQPPDVQAIEAQSVVDVTADTGGRDDG